MQLILYNLFDVSLFRPLSQAYTDYYQAPPSGSCIRGTAKVLMGDETFKPISDLQPGDRVSSVATDGTRYSREVSFVSKPGRRIFKFRNLF